MGNPEEYLLARYKQTLMYLIAEITQLCIKYNKPLFDIISEHVVFIQVFILHIFTCHFYQIHYNKC